MPTRRLQRQDGGVSAEQVAIMLLVAALIAGIWAAMVPGRVEQMAEYAADCLFSLDCDLDDLGDRDGEGPPPPPECKLTIEGEGVDGSVTIASVDLGGSLSYRLTEKGDGTGDSVYEVELEFSGAIAAKLQEGGKVEVGESGAKSGTSGEVKAGAGASVTPVYRFDNQEDARAFVEESKELITGPIDDAASLQTLIPIYGPGRIVKRQWDRINDYDPPPLSATKVQGEVFVEASGSAFGGGAGAEGSLSGAQALGAEFDHDSGDTTMYYKLDAELAASLGMQIARASGSLSQEVVVKVKWDEDFNLDGLELGWTGVATAGGDFNPEMLWFAEGTPLPADVSDALGVGLDVTDEQTWALEATANVDLGDPTLRNAGEQLVSGLMSGDLDAAVDGGGDVVDYAINDSDLLVQYREGDQSSFDVDVSGGKILSFGFGGGYSSDESTIASAWYRPGGEPWESGACET